MLRYLDSSGTIDATSPQSLRHASALSILALHDGEFCVSDLVRMECLVHPLRNSDTTRLTLLRSFFGGLPCLDLPPIVFEDAARIRAVHGLKTADALHVGTALHHGCGEFWTNDLELAKKPLGLTFRAF